MLSMESLATYWSWNEIQANLLIFLNLLGALLLGLLVGYERSFHGRAAGMRTYGLVCMASAGLTVICGYPGQWFAGTHLVPLATDPTRVIQGIVTGIGFLGAGVIMKDGLSISGLTTAASLWASSAIGIMVGVGFYGAAILLALMSMVSMMWLSRLEAWLPNRPAIGVEVRFQQGFEPNMSMIDEFAARHGYEIARGSLCVAGASGSHEWHMVAVARLNHAHSSFPQMSAQLSRLPGVESFRISHARN